MEHLAPAPPQAGEDQVADPRDGEGGRVRQRTTAATAATAAHDLDGDDDRRPTASPASQNRTGTGSTSASGVPARWR